MPLVVRSGRSAGDPWRCEYRREVAATGIPAVLVPWAASAEDHQTANVSEWLADGGAVLSVMLPRAMRSTARDRRRLRADPASAADDRGHGLRGRGDPPLGDSAVGDPGRGRDRRAAGGGGGQVTGTMTVPRPPLDLSAPAAPRGGRRRARHERHRAWCSPRWATSVGESTSASAVLDRVRAAGVVVIGHDRVVVHGADAVTASTAIPATNVELDEARARSASRCCAGPACSPRSAPRPRVVAVAGTHGKTTTTSMLMLILAEAGLRPSFVIGGDVTDMGTGAQWTGGEWFVVEADESDGTHLELPLYGTILTNVEADHLDHYGTLEAIVDRVRPLPRPDPRPEGPVRRRRACVAASGPRDGADTYGIADTATDRRNVDVIGRPGSRPFEASNGRAACSADVQLPLRGRHNVLNATAALAMAGRARRGLRHRRRGARPSSAGWPVASTSAAQPAAHVRRRLRPPAHRDRRRAPRRPRQRRRLARIVAVFQPNRYNRMAELSQEYADAFVAADVIVLTEIYAVGHHADPRASPASSW